MRGDTLAEGIAVKAPGRITSEIVRALVDDILLVTRTGCRACAEPSLDDRESP